MFKSSRANLEQQRNEYPRVGWNEENIGEIEMPELLRWKYFGKWEALSPRFTASDISPRWVICVCQDGKFDLNESDTELCNGIAAFDTLAAAKAFCEGAESAASVFIQDYDRGDGIFVEAVQA